MGPTEAATDAPTEEANNAPTEAATNAPTEAATNAPTEAATNAPTEAATNAVTEEATEHCEPCRDVLEGPMEGYYQLLSAADGRCDDHCSYTDELGDEFCFEDGGYKTSLECKN